MFSSNPVYSHLSLMKKAVAVPFSDLKAGRANALQVDSIRQVTTQIEDKPVVVKRVFIDIPKSDRFLEVGWVMNEGISCCLGCHKDFGTFTRRHHCRGCGTLMCKSCSYYAMIDGFPTIGKQIVCSRCFGATTAAVKLVNKVNWGEVVYSAPGKVFVPNSPKPEAPVAPAVEPVAPVMVAPEVVVPAVPEKVAAETLNVVPVPGFVIRTARLTEGNRPVFINVFQHDDVVDTELSLTAAPNAANSNESVHTATTVESKAAEYEKVSPIVYTSTATTAEHRGQEVVLYNVLVSGAYFKPDRAEGTSSVTHPTSANKIIQVVNHAHNVKLFHFTFALPNPLNGYVGAEIAEPITFTRTSLEVNVVPEREINIAEEQDHFGSAKSEVSGLSADNQSALTDSIPRTPTSGKSGRDSMRGSMKKRGSFLLGERRSIFKASGIALGPEHMVLNMSEHDINDPESRELTYAANENLKLQAVTAPKVLLGHQIIMPYPEDRTDHTLTDADQDNVYVITDVRKDASFHT
eukprot:gene22822-25851_t